MNKELLKRYFDNACTTEERESVVMWLSDPRHKEEVLSYMEDDWSSWRPSESDLEKAGRELDLPFETLLRQATVQHGAASGKPGWLTSRKGRVVGIVSGAAASVLFLLAGAWMGYHYHSRSQANRKAPVFYATAQTLRGQRSKVVLSDGSEVYLNAESRLSFSNEISTRPVVYLEGEAFFKVPEKERPLIVKTKDLVATTKGSQFHISAFPRDSTVTVSVEKGKAEISSNNEKIFPMMALRRPGLDTVSRHDSTLTKPVTMPMLAIRPVVVKANESVTYDRTNQLTTAPARLNEEELRSWKEGYLYFSHADSATLVDKLQRWFDVEVSLDTDGMPLKQMNCGFRNASLAQVLDHIGIDLGLDYRIEGKKVYLTRRQK